jgi:hypothetical protein
VVNKAAREGGRFSPSTSVSLANHHSTNFCITIITRSWHNKPIGGRSAEFTQLGFTFTFFFLLPNIVINVMSVTLREERRLLQKLANSLFMTWTVRRHFA